MAWLRDILRKLFPKSKKNLLHKKILGSLRGDSSNKNFNLKNDNQKKLKEMFV